MEQRHEKKTATAQPSPRRRYAAPEVRRVRLKPEEMVLGACKAPGICYGIVDEGS